jgi:hypothetical protein
MPDLSFLAFVYIGLALGYNVLSLIWRGVAGQTLAPTDPQRGLQVVTLVYLTLIVARDLAPVSGQLVLLVWVLVIAWFGVWAHLRPDPERHYAGPLARWAAVIINLYGIIVITLSVFSHLKQG